MIRDAILLEGVNGNFLCYSFVALLIFSHYIWANWKEGYSFLRPALALWAVFCGDTLLRANFWYARHQNNGGDLLYSPPDWITILGTGLASWGLLCMIAVFAPQKWRTCSWILTLVFTIAFLFITMSKYL